MDGAVWVSLRAFQMWVEGCTATEGGVQPLMFWLTRDACSSECQDESAYMG